nr:MAG: protein of unknown function DUF3310 [Bacteriophage sp.]
MYRNEAHRKAADRPALYGTHINAGEKVYAPEWHAGEVEPIDIIERVVEGLPPDKAYSLGQVLRYCLRAGKKDDMDVELGKANNYAHRLVFGHWRSR